MIYKLPTIKRLNAFSMALPLLVAIGSFLPLSVVSYAQSDGPPIELDAFVVRPIERGNESALQAQRESGTFSTIVSEETLEYLPDQSVGEALARIPGVSILKDRGEAQKITIRGAASRLNAVTLNGDRIPSPDSSVDANDRGANLQSVPATMISGIEVTKSVRADQDGDSIGGIVELKLKRATDLDGPIFNSQVRFGHNTLSDDDMKSFEFTYGNRYGDEGQFGYIVSSSWEENNRAIEQADYSWGTIDELRLLDDSGSIDLGEDKWVIRDGTYMWRDLERIRIGTNLAFDWKASDSALFRVGGFYNEFNDKELRRRMQVRFGSSSDFVEGTTFDENGVVEHAEVDGGRVRHRVRPGQKDTTTKNLYFEGQHIFSDWNMDYRVSKTSSTWELDRNRTRWEFRSSDSTKDNPYDNDDGIVDLTYDVTDSPVVMFQNPTGWVSDPSLAEFGNRGSFDTYDDISDDDNTAITLNFEKIFTLSEGEFRLKAGYKARLGERYFDNGQINYDNEGPDLFMSDFLGENRRTPRPPLGVSTVDWGDQSQMMDLFRSQPDLFSVDDTHEQDNYTNEEDIHAYYAMGTYANGPLRIISGIRQEETEVHSTGFADGGGGIVSSDTSYGNTLPSVIMRYQAAPNTVLRAAWTNSIGRPNYQDIAPRFSVDGDVSEGDEGEPDTASLFVNGGNPGLQAFESENWDLGLEHYIGKSGVFSVGLFKKTIENFEYTDTVNEFDIAVSEIPEFLQQFVPAGFSTLESYGFVRRLNGEKSELDGIELSYIQKFDFLSNGLENFGAIANYTKVDGESRVSETLQRDFLVGQFDYVYNVQLYHEVDKHTTRLAYNYNGEQFTSIDEGNPGNDRFDGAEETWDFSFQYRLPSANKQWSFNFDIKNLFDQESAVRFRDSVGARRIQDIERVGRLFIVGVGLEM